MALTRRRLVGLAAAAVTVSACGGSRDDPGVPEPSVHRYGDDDAQVGTLHRPASVRHPGVVVVLHGGFWRAQYGADLGEPLARDLADRGWTAWNLEYRRVGDGGGWPSTFADVAAGIDHLAELGDGADPLDLGRVLVVGHSAGGQLAAWAAARPRLPAGAPGARPVVPVAGVVSQAGVLALTDAARDGVGSGAVTDLLGGGPDEVPERYAVADPTRLLPLGVPVRCVHAPADDVVPLSQSASFVDAARSAGDDAALVRASGDHFSLIDPESGDWRRCRSALEDLEGAQ